MTLKCILFVGFLFCITYYYASNLDLDGKQADLSPRGNVETLKNKLKTKLDALEQFQYDETTKKLHQEEVTKDNAPPVLVEINSHSMQSESLSK